MQWAVQPCNHSTPGLTTLPQGTTKDCRSDWRPHYGPFTTCRRISAHATFRTRWTPVIFADAYVRTAGKTSHKAGHIPCDAQFPAHSRDDNGWGYMVRIGSQVLFCHGTTPHSVLRQINSRKRHSCTPWRCSHNWWPSLHWLNACLLTGSPSSTPQQVRLRERHARRLLGHGGTPWLEATVCPRVESKANVADAISRGDLSRASQEGWTRLDDHTDHHGHPHQSGLRTKCALPGASQFWGRNVGSRARSAFTHPERRRSSARTRAYA